MQHRDHAFVPDIDGAVEFGEPPGFERCDDHAGEFAVGDGNLRPNGISHCPLRPWNGVSTARPRAPPAESWRVNSWSARDCPTSAGMVACVMMPFSSAIEIEPC